jgi:hypothetical protein
VPSAPTASPKLRLAMVLAAVVLATAGILGIAGLGDPAPGGVPTVAPPPGGGDEQALPDPYAWDPEREEDFTRRAATGTSHLLYRLSPGGVVASAERTARWRPHVEAAARAAGVDADTLEGLVFLESAGRDDAITPNGIEGAAGLTQILAGTATDLLDLEADTARSGALSRRIAREQARGHERKVAELRRARAAADERFDGPKALAATGRYLKLARETFGREDLAFVSYHMGIGNLQGVLRAFGEGDDPSYAQLYFDSSFARHPEAYSRLTGLGDDSSNYFWKVLAGREIMRLYREDRPELDRLAGLHAAKGSAEEVLHPNGSVPRFGDPEQLRDAWDRDEIVALPDAPRLTGLRRDPRMGELARRLGQPAGLYRGLRPEALALALYLGAQVRALSGTSPLVVTSTVRDEAYQRELVARNREATRNYSLHTTGWAFDVERRYVSRRQALAFQSMLDRLSVLGAITWVREPDAIHITVAREARVLLPLLERLKPSP